MVVGTRLWAVRRLIVLLAMETACTRRWSLARQSLVDSSRQTLAERSCRERSTADQRPYSASFERLATKCTASKSHGVGTCLALTRPLLGPSPRSKNACSRTRMLHGSSTCWRLPAGDQLAETATAHSEPHPTTARLEARAPGTTTTYLDNWLSRAQYEDDSSSPRQHFSCISCAHSADGYPSLRFDERRLANRRALLHGATLMVGGARCECSISGNALDRSVYRGLSTRPAPSRRHTIP